MWAPPQDLAWFLTEGLLTLEAGRAVPAAVRGLCAALAPHYRTLADAFGIPDHLVGGRCLGVVVEGWC